MPNQRFKFTDLAIRNLAFSDAVAFAYDTSCPTLALRIGKRTKCFFVMRPNGERLTIGKYPFVSLMQARQRCAGLLQAKYAAPGTAVAPDASQAVAEYLSTHGQKTRFNTHKAAKNVLNLKFIPRFGTTPLNLITPRDLSRFIDSFLDTPATAIKVHSVLSAFLNWAKRQEYIDSNPLTGIPLPAKAKTRERVLSDQELAAVLRTAQRIAHTPFGAIVLILLFTGLRRGEVHSLLWTDVTPETITIRKEIAKNHIELCLPNTIPNVFAAIPRTYATLFPEKLDWARGKAAFDEQSGVTAWVLHDIRRTLSTKMAEWEIATPDVVEAILNHVSGSRSKIQRIYDRHSRLPQMQRALTAYVDRLHALIKAN